MVMMAVGDISADVEVLVRIVKTLMMYVQVLLEKRNVTITLFTISMDLLLLITLNAACSSDQAACCFTSSNKTSCHSHRSSIILLQVFAKCLIAPIFSIPFWSPKHTTSAFSLLRWLFYTLTGLSYAHCLIYGCHFLLSSYIIWTVHSPLIPTQ